MVKEANIAKVHFLMKEKGMGAKEAIKAAYPEWSDEKVAALAAKLSGMKDAGMGKAKEGPPTEEKTAKVTFSPAMDKSPALKGKQSRLPDSVQAAILKKKLKKKAEITKTSKLRVHDVEDEIGDYLSDKDETKVRKMITLAKKKSFAMRHPILTGIPTLGIAPAAANKKAKMKIIRQLAKSDPKMRKQLRSMREAARKESHEKEVARIRSGSSGAPEKGSKDQYDAMAALARAAAKGKEQGALGGRKKEAAVKLAQNAFTPPAKTQSLITDKPKPKPAAGGFGSPMGRMIGRAAAGVGRQLRLGGAQSLQGQRVRGVSKGLQNRGPAAKGVSMPKAPGSRKPWGGLASAAGAAQPSHRGVVGFQKTRKGKAQAAGAGGYTTVAPPATTPKVQGSGWTAPPKGGQSMPLTQTPQYGPQATPIMGRVKGYPKTASVQLVALQQGSEALYESYMQKHALLNPVTTAKISKFFRGLLTKAKPAAKVVSDTVGTTAKHWGGKLSKTFPGATKKSKEWLAAFVKSNPEAAAAIKKHWKPAAGGVAAGAIIHKAMSD
jgi:hypothetical protein